MYACPVCKKRLVKDIHNNVYGSLVCENNHSFDYSKQGYVNLLLSDKMHSKAPGDNKLMIDARNSFLKKGYYSPFMKSLINEVDLHNPKTVLDAGCGEGYYTSHLFSGNRYVFGVDISKNALVYASKKNKNINYCVASLFNLPFFDKAFDMIVSLFSPYAGEEFHRVLKKDGIMILGIPGENHLIEIKRLLYDNPYKNDVKDFYLDGFNFIKNTDVKFNMNLKNSQDILNLFKMTPYYYRTPKDKIQNLLSVEHLNVTADFKLLVYKKDS